MTQRPSFPVSRLDYELPPELIAQQPLKQRGDSRLLHVSGDSGPLLDKRFTDLPGLLPEGCLIVLNNSRVIPARIFGQRKSGGKVEVLFHRWIGDGIAEAVVGSRGWLPVGDVLELPGGWTCELLEPKALDGVRVRYIDTAGNPATLEALLEFLQAEGTTPLPPYIRRERDSRNESQSQLDGARYQTVYAAQTGSVAAPTAGLHFDNAMLDRLRRDGHETAYVTLHVGLGTFAPVRVDDLADHEMHGELYSVEPMVIERYFAALDAGRTVLAVGTTSLRALHTLLESRGNPQPSGETRAFIYPGCGTQATGLLLTNFHLPRSTLLALVYALSGEERMREAYAHAVAQRYRFFSYGDCMLIDPQARGRR